MTPSKTRSPWLFVPTLYFQQGLPVILIQQFSVLMYKKLGLPNDQIGLWTSLITWPWILKMFWGPMVDRYSTKRDWVRMTQILTTAALALSALFVSSEHFLVLTLAVFAVGAFFSATHDIALDAYYLIALKPEQQAFFVGIRSTFFRLAMIFCTGALVVLAGKLEAQGYAIARSWQIAILAGAALYGMLMLYGFWAAPKMTSDLPIGALSANASDEPSFKEAFRTFFAQKGIWVILGFILLYRFGESMLSKMTGVFLLDSPNVGGLGLSTLEVGMIMGNVGVISLVLGGLTGGMAISKFGLRACIWPMALAMYVPNLLYLWAAKTLPGAGAVTWIIGVDQFGYGFGLASYLVYVMSICRKSRYKASHYAIATGLMALGAMSAGIASGYLQQSLGYFQFFVAVCLFTIPGVTLLQFIPLENSAELEKETAEAAAQA